MAFIFGVLVIGALLSIIFGRRVGAMFVTGTWAVVTVGFGILLILLAPLIWGFFTTPLPAPANTPFRSPSGSTSYSTPVPGNGYSPVPASTVSVNQASATNSSGGSLPAVAPQPSGPTIGVTTQPADPSLSAQFSMTPGYGATIMSVAPGSPAEQAGLVPGDFVQAMDDDPLTADHTLADYAARKGAGKMIVLSVEHNDSNRWVHEWIKVTPR